MKNKKLFTDVETTGRDGEMNGIHQISGILMIDNVEVEKFDFKVKPFESDLIETEALNASGATYDQIMTYEDPLVIHDKMISIFERHCNRFNRNDKFHFIAYNSNFDNNHYREWFKKCGDKYFGSWFFTPDLCVMRQAGIYLQNERHKLQNFQLATVAEYLGVVKDDDEVKWHDAMADVEVTRDIYYEVTGESYTKKDKNE